MSEILSNLCKRVRLFMVRVASEKLPVAVALVVTRALAAGVCCVVACDRRFDSDFCQNVQQYQLLVDEGKIAFFFTCEKLIFGKKLAATYEGCSLSHVRLCAKKWGNISSTIIGKKHTLKKMQLLRLFEDHSVQVYVLLLHRLANAFVSGSCF